MATMAATTATAAKATAPAPELVHVALLDVVAPSLTHLFSS
jgi:hypothetical protein